MTHNAADSESPSHTLNVLLVDDDVANRGMFLIMLRELDLDNCQLTVTTAKDGVDALRLMQIETQHIANEPLSSKQHQNYADADSASHTSSPAFDLIFMDCRMPEMDGYETTRRIRTSRGRQSHIIIVGLTAASTVGDRDLCLATGMNDYLNKPIAIEDFSAIIQKWLPHMLKAQQSAKSSQ